MSSKSSSSSAQSTANYDQRVANESGIVVSAGSTYTNNLPEEAAQIFNRVFDFAGDVVSRAGAIAESAVMGAQTTANKTVDSQSAVAQNAQLGNASFFTTNAPWLIAGLVAIVFFTRRK